MGLSFEEFERVWQESSLPSNIGTTGPTERRFEWVLGQTAARGGSALTAARSLGIPAVRATWSHTDGELPEDVPSVATPHDLLNLIAAGRPRPAPSH